MGLWCLVFGVFLEVPWLRLEGKKKRYDENYSFQWLFRWKKGWHCSSTKQLIWVLHLPSCIFMRLRFAHPHNAISVKKGDSWCCVQLCSEIPHLSPHQHLNTFFSPKAWLPVQGFYIGNKILLVIMKVKLEHSSWTIKVWRWAWVLGSLILNSSPWAAIWKLLFKTICVLCLDRTLEQSSDLHLHSHLICDDWVTSYSVVRHYKCKYLSV